MKNSISIKNKIEASSLLKVAPFRKEIRKTEPHKHNSYLEIIYLREGSGLHTIDHTSFSIIPPTVFFVRKEQVHHWDMTDTPDGYVLLLKKGFVDHSLDRELKSLLSKLSGLSCIHLKETESIDTLFQMLTIEKDFTVTEGLLKALFAKILIAGKPSIIKSRKSDGAITIFRELLNQTNDLQNNVNYYAEKLHMTPQNLNVICRKALDQSAAEVIAEHIISEAKRQLMYTISSVSEIAFKLNFKDTSHFVKYFKRYTGLTPQTFRNT